MHLVRFLIRPLGYLVFVVAITALSAAAWVLGDKHDLGFFAARLSKTVWRYPEVTRRGVQMAWLVWAGLFAFALSDAIPWDEAALGALALVVLWRRFSAGHRA